jgi:hypothetical protein
MSARNEFPGWIAAAIDKNQTQLNPKSKEFIAKAIELFPHFDESFLSIPSVANVGVLKNHSPGDVEKFYGLESSIEFILLNICEKFHFTSTYQIRELGLSLVNSLNEGRFFVSAITLRAMCEVITVNYYTFRRIDTCFKDGLRFLQSAAKSRSVIEKEKLLTKYYEKTHQMFSLVFDANAATSLKWRPYLEKFNISVETESCGKKIHVSTAIDDLEKHSKLPLIEAYEVMSEFVHPNAGSKMLIVNTKNTRDEMMDALTIGENKNNSEAVLFFVDHLAESLYYTLTLALTLFARSQELIAIVDRLVPDKASKTVH